MEICFFCKKRLPNPATSRSPLNDSWHYECPRCGIVHVSDTLAVISDPEIEKNRHIISGVLRWRSIRKIKYSLLTTDNFKDLLSDPEIPQTIPQKIDKLIEFMALRSGAFGAPVDLNNDEDYPITFSSGRLEFDQILSYLQKHKVIETASLSDPGSTLSMDGWKMYYDLQKKRVDLSQCFVAMNFDPSYDHAFQKIKEAVEHCGFSAYRVKDVQHNDNVTDLIIAGIRKSGFLIADFTGQRAGVYFEAGFARGLGRIVIWTCKESDKDNIHFDTDHFAHIFWKDEEDLKKQLIDRIEATVK